MVFFITVRRHAASFVRVGEAREEIGLGLCYVADAEVDVALRRGGREVPQLHLPKYMGLGTWGMDFEGAPNYQSTTVAGWPSSKMVPTPRRGWCT